MKSMRTVLMAAIVMVGFALNSSEAGAGNVIFSTTEQIVTLSTTASGLISGLMPKQEGTIAYDDEGHQYVVVKTIPGSFPVLPTDVKYIGKLDPPSVSFRSGNGSSAKTRGSTRRLSMSRVRLVTADEVTHVGTKKESRTV